VPEHLYTREENENLPSNKSDLSVVYTTIEENDVSKNDGVRVGLTGEEGNYLLHQFKKLHNNRRDRIKIKVNLQSSLAPSLSTVYLQIWNGQTNSWETLDSNNKADANVDFSLFGDVSDTSYYDFNNEVAIRVYQYAITT